MVINYEKIKIRKMSVWSEKYQINIAVNGTLNNIRNGLKF